jgi:hypothetical protein
MDDPITTDHHHKIDLFKKVFNMEIMIQWEHLSIIDQIYSSHPISIKDHHPIVQISILQMLIILLINSIIPVLVVVQAALLIGKMIMKKIDH